MHSTLLRSWVAGLFVLAACGDSGGDDVLAFANSSGAEVTVTVTFPDGATQQVVLAQSSMAEETPIAVSFIAGEVYSFQFVAGGALAPTSLSCEVATTAELSGVAAVLVLLDSLAGGLSAQCLTNWVESPF